MVNPHDDPIKLRSSRYEVWRERFVAERGRILDAVATKDIEKDILRIEHVGSTAVPDFPAKDIVDLDIVVADDTVSAIARTLETELGGTRHENTSTWHPIFRSHDGQRYNDHVFAVSGNKWKTSVVTREVLCTHREVRAEYARLKRELATDHDDLAAYSRGKTAFIERVLRIGREDDDLEFDFVVPTVE
ncbi:GrpB family protein [Halococcus sp. IIIV-5B]|uniref:GrpB family protein n=1 Tax=Halococcus sp. IIIV-5B TaxID=2321230 RepID=UPI000E77172D|nr:GrpB family protein [Halococcus sp. IIIV-5B]RJT01391.1 GrpB family protein [Halococcus sp. IIIV-5B]